MNKLKDFGQKRLSPMSSSSMNSSIPSAIPRDRRAVVEMYVGPQLMADEAMLPMPPHNMAQSPKELFQFTRQWMNRCQKLLRLLKRSF